MKLTALIPMRHGSQRVPGKNWRPFAGRPLYHWVVETLLTTPQVTAVVIDSDSPVILENAAHHFPMVRLLHRPPELGGGEVPMNAVLLHAVNQLPGEWFLQTHATNPLLTAATITRAAERFQTAQPDHDSLFSVTRRQVRLWDQEGKPVNHNPNILLPTQALPPLYEENSCLYLFSRTTLIERQNRIGAHPFLFEMDRREAQDIDEEEDFLLAETLFQEENKGKHPWSR